MRSSLWKKPLLRLLPLLVSCALGLRAADLESATVQAALIRADDERVAAVKAGDGPRLEAIFSDDLRYAHSSGHVDDKASYMKALTSHNTVYESYDYKQRDFKTIAPGIALMTGHVLIHSKNTQGSNDLDLNFLAVWREENGRWRFLAWQSCKNPPAAPAGRTK